MTAEVYRWLPTTEWGRTHAVHANAPTYQVARFPAVITACGRDINLPVTEPDQPAPQCRQCLREVDQ